MAQPSDRRALTPDECAALLQVSPSTLVRWIRSGYLPEFVRPGRRPGAGVGKKTYRIWDDDWQAFCDRWTQVGVLPLSPPTPLQIIQTGYDTDGDRRDSEKAV